MGMEIDIITFDKNEWEKVACKFNGVNVCDYDVIQQTNMESTLYDIGYRKYYEVRDLLRYVSKIPTDTLYVELTLKDLQSLMAESNILLSSKTLTWPDEMVEFNKDIGLLLEFIKTNDNAVAVYIWTH